MPRSEKWLVELDVQRSTLEVADEILRERLQAMSRLLEKTVDADDDVEAVHDLRVCTRRTDAALLLFQPLIPKKRCKRLQRRLRRLRSAAGAVRDCDVHWKRLIDETRPHRALLKSIRRERKQARKKLRQVQENLIHKERFQKQSRKLVKKLDETPLLASSFRDYPTFARHSLGEHADSFFHLAHSAAQDDENLHQLRIAAKRWRYALELASGVLAGPWADELHEQLTEIQDRLGQVHDVEALCSRVERGLKSQTPQERSELRKVLKQQRERLAELRGELARWWTTARQGQLAECWQRASGLWEGHARQIREQPNHG